MALYSGASKQIKNALKQLLTELEIDAGKKAFISVLDSTQGEFDGYPALRLLPNDLTSDKPTVGESDKAVQFLLRFHLPLENKPESESATTDRMYDLTDLVIDKLDGDDYAGRMSEIDPTVQTLYTNASRGDWTKQSSPIGLILMCDVTVTITYSREL